MPRHAALVGRVGAGVNRPLGGKCDALSRIRKSLTVPFCCYLLNYVALALRCTFPVYGLLKIRSVEVSPQF